MRVFQAMKRLLIKPLFREVPTILLGRADQWALPVDSLDRNSFIVSAGVGTSITFEQDLVSRYDARIVLLDPSPTGVGTMRRLGAQPKIDFLPIGLAGDSGEVRFGLPDRPDEGSYRRGSATDANSFQCTTLAELMKKYGRSRINLLKIDVEGFEYEILQSMFEQCLAVDQICLEIHHNRVISIEQTIFDAAILIIRMAAHGYVCVYNRNMDFSFIKADILARLSTRTLH